MTIIPAALAQILSYLGTILGIVQFVFGRSVKVAQETTDFLIQDAVKAIQGDVDNVGFGLFAIKTDTANVLTNLAADTAAILAAIGTPQQAGSPVTLPTIPPTGYGSTDPAALAAAVWNFPGPTSSQPAIDLQEDAAIYSIQIASWANQIGFEQFAGWELVPQQSFTEPVTSDGVLLPLDFSTVLASDNNAVDWLNRLWGATYFLDAGGGVPSQTDAFGNFFSVPWLNTPMFQILRDQVLGRLEAKVPPVWPGLAGVTLGTPVAIDAGVTISLPMDGVLIDITAAPLKQGYFTFDTAISYRNIGALAFVSDNGQEEFPQTLGFTSAVYCPKTMRHAAGLVFRASADLTGTITPFTLI